MLHTGVFLRIRHGARALLLILVATESVTLGAQENVPASLSLAEAMEIAQRNNPTYLQTQNDERLADWDVRQAYGALLPTASANSGVSWQGAGAQQIGGLTLGDLGIGAQPDYYFSNYSLNFNYSLNWAKVKAPAQAKAQRGATLAQIRIAASMSSTKVIAPSW